MKRKITLFIIVCISYVSAVFSFDDVLETSKKKLVSEKREAEVLSMSGLSQGIRCEAVAGRTETAPVLDREEGMICCP